MDRSTAAAGSPRLRAFRIRLARAARSELQGSLPVTLIERALQDAEALAAITPLPEFFLPGLAEEKLAEAARWNLRQTAILEATGLAFAA